jgi:hypothetical protein
MGNGKKKQTNMRGTERKQKKHVGKHFRVLVNC